MKCYGFVHGQADSLKGTPSDNPVLPQKGKISFKMKCYEFSGVLLIPYFYLYYIHKKQLQNLKASIIKLNNKTDL